jgi:hypothetical protein
MALGKTIKLYLMDGSPNGPISAEIGNWSGQVIVVPRAQLHELAKRPELQRTGVYILVGRDATATNIERLYVGEADDIFARLKSHDKDPDKEFWTRAITMTSKDFNLTKAHGRYLESRLIELATAAGRARVSNGTAPGQKTLPESDISDMEYFLEQVKLMLPVLGFDFLRSTAIPEAIGDGAESPLLQMSDVGAIATARELDGNFVVLKGSTARRQGAPSWDSYKNLRDDLVKLNKLIVKDSDFFEFATDVEFSSPSAAAAVVAAAARNGRISWRLSGSKTYADWKEEQVEEAET